jgi:DNA-binding response OmpR family regulator
MASFASIGATARLNPIFMQTSLRTLTLGTRSERFGRGSAMNDGGLVLFSSSPGYDAFQAEHCTEFASRAEGVAPMSRLFFLEDDVQLGTALQRSLNQAGFIVDWRRRVADARVALVGDVHSAIILDVELPDGSGFEVLDWLRAREDHTPVLILTVRDAVDDRVRGLDAGADDYLLKPFAVVELISRVHALIRRSAGHAKATWRIGQLELEPARHCASLDGQALDLSPKEYQLLFELARRTGQVVTRANLEAAVFRSPSEIESNLLEVHVHHLRRKIGARMIRTVRGVGYVLDA